MMTSRFLDEIGFNLGLIVAAQLEATVGVGADS
jgi:hypothetical protein